MPLYRWEDFQCTNVGNCKQADRRDVIDLPRGADAICPTCGKPVVPLRAREIVLVSPPSTARLRPGKRRFHWLLASAVLLVLGLVGGTASLLMRSPGLLMRSSQTPPPERLYLGIPAQVTARVGDDLQVPLAVGPVSAANLELTVDGTLPLGVSLDVAGRRLYGTVRSAGISPIIVTARAPHYASASAETNIIVKPNLAPAPVLSLRVPPEVEGRVGDPLEVPLAVSPLTDPDPVLTVVGKLPAGVSLDGMGKRLFGIPRSPGSYGVIVKASTPDNPPALAEVTFTIMEAKPAPTPTVLDAKPSPTSGEDEGTMAKRSPTPTGDEGAIARRDSDRTRTDASPTPAPVRLRRGKLTTRNGK
ncbi:MAG: hypothetical protein JOY92_09940 [Verrucomicrobia bacterium]|nr:hypothetical protein [Verrucomicrobiota bacterium]